MLYVIAAEHSPGLKQWFGVTDHVFRHSSLTHTDAQQLQFSVCSSTRQSTSYCDIILISWRTSKSTDGRPPRL